MTPESEQQATPPPKVAAVVVSHNRAECLRRCLDALERVEARDTLEVIVVDNGSSDWNDSLDDEFPLVHFIPLPKNFGLTKALNIGIRATEAEYVLLLHDDTEVAPDAVRLLAETLDRTPEAAAVCPLLVDAAGSPAAQLGDLPPTDTYRPATAGTEPVAVAYPRGAALMVRLFFLRAMRHIDERYGQFGSDAELAQQVRRGSKKILLVPAARVKHSGREGNSALRRADAIHGQAAWRGKYLGLGAGLMARLGAILRALAGLRLGEFRYALIGQKIDGTMG